MSLAAYLAQQQGTPAVPPLPAEYRGLGVTDYKVGDALPLTASVTAVFITPALAQDWLNRYSDPKKRAIRAKRATEYAADMQRGGWMWGTANIVFVANGGVALDNGHHRLTGVVESQTGVWMIVVTGAEPAVRNVTDIGIGRTGGDNIRMWGGKTFPNEVASYVKMYLIYQQTVDTAITWRPSTPTFTGILTPSKRLIPETWQQDEARWDSIGLAMKNARPTIMLGIPPKTVGAFVYIAEVAYPGEGIKFLQDMAAGLRPELSLALTKMTHGRPTTSGTQLEFDRKVMELLVRAFNAARAGTAFKSPHSPFNLSRIK